jgi:hypothetical protein
MGVSFCRPVVVSARYDGKVMTRIDQRNVQNWAKKHGRRSNKSSVKAPRQNDRVGLSHLTRRSIIWGRLQLDPLLVPVVEAVLRRPDVFVFISAPQHPVTQWMSR